MIFVDSGAWLGLFDKADQHHKEALQVRGILRDNGLPLCTTNLVLSESLTLIARKVNYRYAAEVGQGIYSMQVLTILRADREAEELALKLLAKWSDQKVSYCDCLSFTLMRLYGIKRAFTFDRHFALAGFESLSAH